VTGGFTGSAMDNLNYHHLRYFREVAQRWPM